MSRYTIVSEWELDTYDNDPVVIDGKVVAVQSATLKDTQNGHEYRQGAYRVVVGQNGVMGSMKPIKGKGGTVPFKGETAWSDAARLFGDTVLNLRYAR